MTLEQAERDSSSLRSAIVEIRELGDFFAVAVMEKTGKSIDDNSPLMNGLVAYYQLELKGESESFDEAVDMVMNAIYKLVTVEIRRGNKP